MDAVSTWWTGKEGLFDERPERNQEVGRAILIFVERD